MIKYLDKIYDKLSSFFYRLSPKIYLLSLKQEKLVKFVIVGFLATSINVFFLYVLTEFLGVWYLISAGLAFIIALVFSFFLQKLWTFKSEDDNVADKNTKTQVIIYFSVVFFSLLINLVGMYVLVSIFRFYYLIAQLITAGTLAVVRFFINNFLIFNLQDEV